MATTNIKQLESFDSGSNYNFQDKMLDPQGARSVFDLSYRSVGSIAGMGVLQPIACIPTLPSDSFQINFQELLRALPTVTPLESRQRQYIYCFWNRLGDLYQNFETFMKKGYSGNVVKKIPVLTEGKNTSKGDATGATSLGNTMKIKMYGRQNSGQRNSTWENADGILSNSLGECLGLPHNYTKETHTIDGNSVTAYANRSTTKTFIKGSGADNIEEISALPFMMYLRIWRDYFTNKNYWINDRIILPDDDTEFRLADDGQLISARDYPNTSEGSTEGIDAAAINIDIGSRVKGLSVETTTYSTNKYKTYTFGLMEHEYPKDRWLSALPFLQRGDAPKLQYTITTPKIPTQLAEWAGGVGTDKGLLIGTAADATNLQMKVQGGTLTAGQNYVGYVNLDNSNITLDIKMSDIRRLAIEQTELEKMAHTDGSYAEFGMSFFGIVSKNAIDHKPVYVGGAYKEIVYTEVVQTSQSDKTPMGSYTGHSTSSLGDNIGSISCDDYGYLMIISCIMPDVIYAEGLKDHWTNLLQSQMYLPERAKLGMTNLLNKTIYFDYTNSAAAKTYNNNLFAYQNIADDYRYLPSEVKGDLADGFSFSFFSYTQSRIFGQQINWGRELALADKNNVRLDYLAAPTETPFTYDINFGIRAVRPIPYKPIPANLTGL